MEQRYQTKSRKLLLSFFKQNKNRLITVEDITIFLKRENESMNLSTIYRNLEFFEQQGTLIKNHDLKKERATYQFVGETDTCYHHLHLKCETCGKLMHLECTFMSEISTHLKEEHQFLLNCQSSLLMGNCEKCLTY